jgi:hypothetical protein
MRALIAFVPIVLVGAYVALADRSDSDHRESRDATIRIPDAPMMVVADVRPAVKIAAGTRQRALAAAAEARAGRAQVHAEARAAMELTLDGLLQIIAGELEGTPAAGEAATAEFAVSAALLAELTASLDGLVQIQVQDSDHVLLSASDGAATVRLAIER